MTKPSKSVLGRHAEYHLRRHIVTHWKPLPNKERIFMDKTHPLSVKAFSCLNKVTPFLPKILLTNQAMRHGGPSSMQHGRTCSRLPR